LEFLGSYDAEAVYAGESSGSSACEHGPEEAEANKGNSVLLALGEGNMLFVGTRMFTFKAGLASPGFRTTLLMTGVLHKSSRNAALSSARTLEHSLVYKVTLFTFGFAAKATVFSTARAPPNLCPKRQTVNSECNDVKCNDVTWCRQT